MFMFLSEHCSRGTDKSVPLFLSFSIHPMHLRRHIEHAFRELDAQTRALVDEFVQEL